MIAAPPGLATSTRVWRRRDPTHPVSRPTGQRLPDKDLRATCKKLFPKLWDHLTEQGRSHFVADMKAVSRLGEELALSQTILDWHITMALLHEPGFREHLGREPQKGEPVDDLDEFLNS